MKTGKLLIDSYIDTYDPKKYIKVFEKVIIARGGDGTLIKAIHKYKNLNKPFYGLKGGTVGFMMNSSPFDISIKLKTIKMQMIKVKITYLEEQEDYFNPKDEYVEHTRTYQAFNEICLGGDPRIWGHFNIKEKDDIIGSFSGSGIVISTPQGSTAINKNNQGSVLPLGKAVTKDPLWLYAPSEKTL